MMDMIDDLSELNNVTVSREEHDGTLFDVYSGEFWSSNTIEVKAGTTGFCGGDSGHGCRTYIKIADVGGTDIEVKSTESSVEILLGGDCELSTLINGLYFMLSILKKQAYNDNTQSIILNLNNTNYLNLVNTLVANDYKVKISKIDVDKMKITYEKEP